MRRLHASAGVLLAAGVAFASNVDLVCPDVSFTVSTGSSSGDCIIEPGVRALCVDLDSSSAWARCDAGCQSTHASGWCGLAGEEEVGGTLVLSCENGDRYLLRTGTGNGDCRGGPVGGGLRSARCKDTRDHQVEASCSEGCVKTRGSAICARYKKEAPAKP